MPKVLIVDDDARICTLFSAMLERHGFRTAIESDGNQIVPLLSSCHRKTFSAYFVIPTFFFFDLPPTTYLALPRSSSVDVHVRLRAVSPCAT